MKALLFFTALVLASPVSVRGQTAMSLPPGASVIARQIQRDGDTIRLRGAVIISSPTAEIRADEANIRTASGAMETELRGNVRIRLITLAPLDPEQQAVMKVDEAYRVAKLEHDIHALDGILADQFSETNQNSNTRNKVQTIELWKTFRITSLTTDSFSVRIIGGTAVVTGMQAENATDRMLFSRSYVRTSGGWKLAESMQFLDPRGLNRTQ